MNAEEKLALLSRALDKARIDAGTLGAEILQGEVPVLMIMIEDREEFPIYITIDDSQILCISHLWTDAEVQAERRVELLESLLMMNVPMPLSAFSKVGGQYIIFNALPNQADINDMLATLDALSDNTLTAIEEFAEFLVSN